MSSFDGQRCICQRTKHQKKELGMQRSAIGDANPMVAPPIVHEVLNSPGQPLDTETRAFMEPRFGHSFSKISVNQLSTPQSKLTINRPDDVFEQEADCIAGSVVSTDSFISGARLDFSRVRIHTDAKAAESARAVNSLAYTVGRNLVFAEGQYSPHTSTGRNLIAHELTHVLQQRGTGNSATGENLSMPCTGLVGHVPTNALQRLDSETGSLKDDPVRRANAAIGTAKTVQLINLQHEFRTEMAKNAITPPSSIRTALATIRHWTMNRIATIRDRYNSNAASFAPLSIEALDDQLDQECTPLLNVLMEGHPEYRYEHYEVAVQEKVQLALNLHASRRGLAQIGHRVTAERESRNIGSLPNPDHAWCGAFAYTQAHTAAAMDPKWKIFMQGEGGIRSALAYQGESSTFWVWAFDHWENLREYHSHRGSLRSYELVGNTPPPRGIEPGDLVLMDNAFGILPDHITTAVSFDGRFLTTMGGNQGSGEDGVSRNSPIDISMNPAPNDVTKWVNGEKKVDETKGPKHVRVHGVGRWSIVDYEYRVYRTGPRPTAPPTEAELSKVAR